MPGNPWSKSNARIKELEAEVKELRARDGLRTFANHFTDLVGTLLANTPFSEWDDAAKVAFTYAAKKFPVYAQEYKERLPKKI